jgi:hypothetical protein
MMKSIKKYQWKKHEKPKKEQQKECGSNMIEKKLKENEFEKKMQF